MSTHELNMEVYRAGLWRISPLDGREVLFTGSLHLYLSEGALHLYRARVMIEALIALSESDLPNRPVLDGPLKETLRQFVVAEWYDSMAVAEYDHFGRNNERPFEHDLKAVEYYLRELFDQAGLSHLKEWLHFPMTSEDVNNLAWNLMLRDAINQEWLPAVLAIMDRLANYAVQYATVPVLGSTHGMNASPTTFGKRFSYILAQISNVLKQLAELTLSGKFGGATGNQNAMVAVAPEFDIMAFARQFVERFGFTYDENTHQRNSHLTIVRLLQEIKLLNTLMIQLCEDIRFSVAMGWLRQEGKPGHVGSSVMPHKINPWYFEVAQGYLEQANALIAAAADGLLLSLFERDLTDHPWERAYGEMVGKGLVAMRYIADGLDSIRVNDEYALHQLQATPEVLTEAVQIAGRYIGIPGIYMVIKNMARGRKLDRETLNEIIVDQITDEVLRDRLLAMSPADYTGAAEKIATWAAADYVVLRQNISRGILDPMFRIRAVLFDFDGTLHHGDKEELRERLFEISSRMNLGFTMEEIKQFGNRSDYREMRTLMVNEYNRRGVGPAITEDDFSAINAQVSGSYDHHFYLTDGAKELLQLLRQIGVKLGLVTTRGSNSLPRLLELHGIADLFDVIVNRDDCKERKPHPQPLALALSRLGIEQSQHAMYVGDLQVDDVIAGKALSMQTALINARQLDPFGAQPDHHFSSLLPLAQKFLRCVAE